MTRAVLLAGLAWLCAAGALLEAARAGPGRRGAAGRRRRERAAADDRPRFSATARALGRIGRRAAPAVTAPGDLSRRLAAAGLPAAVSVADVMAVKAGCAAAGAAAGVAVLVPAALGHLGPVLLLAGPAAGYLAPDLWLRRRAGRRAALLSADLADVLDLVRVAVAAGLPVGRALGSVGERRGGPLAGELRVCAELMELGLAREDALAHLGRRCPLPGVLALVAAVGRAERHGVPLAPALGALAVDARADRARRVQDRAARAAPKIQLAVALLLVPAAMLALAAGMVADMT